MKKKPNHKPKARVSIGAPPKRGRHDRRAIERVHANIGKIMERQDIADMDEANEFLQDLLAANQGHVPDQIPETPLEEAQNIMWDAFDEPSKKKRVALAKKALATSPDCADAYVLLAEECDDLHEVIELLRKGVEAGERALGPEAFTEDVGHFWGILETRPYMRARHALASLLAMEGERETAIDHLRELLRLNPNDNQGVRYELLPVLTIIGDLVSARELWDQYAEDGTAPWLYGGALLTFLQKGDCPKARREFKRAFKANPFVVLLAGLPEEIDNLLGDAYALGSPEEAAEYLVGAAESWASTPGAADWFVAQSGALVADPRYHPNWAKGMPPLP